MDAKSRSKTSRNADVNAIKHWMSPAPHSVGWDQRLDVAHDLMRAHKVRHLPVLKNGRLVGMLSQRDLYFLESITGVDVHVDFVEEGMSRDVYTVAPDEPLTNVVREMAKHRYGSAVVMESTKVVGIFTTTDALKLLARHASKAPTKTAKRAAPSHLSAAS
jgi:acetoin utilization protein AcuB